MNLAYEKAEKQINMKQSMLMMNSVVQDRSESELDNIMDRLEERCRLKLNRDDVLQVPLGILREYYRVWMDVGSLDKAKEGLMRSTFNTRNSLMYYNKAIFSEKTAEVT